MNITYADGKINQIKVEEPVLFFEQDRVFS